MVDRVVHRAALLLLAGLGAFAVLAMHAALGVAAHALPMPDMAQPAADGVVLLDHGVTSHQGMPGAECALGTACVAALGWLLLVLVRRDGDRGLLLGRASTTRSPLGRRGPARTSRPPDLHALSVLRC